MRYNNVYPFTKEELEEFRRYMSEEFGSDFITIIDDDGQEFELEVLDTMDYNGKTYTEVGTFALAEANVAVDSYGTVKSVFVFDTVEAKYVQFKFKAGSSRPVLGANPADGKVNWEFVALTGVTVSDESKHKHPPRNKKGRLIGLPNFLR